MSNFRTKLLGIAAVATAFAGVSFGQITCAAPTTSYSGVAGINPTIRVESQTELVADYSSVCTNGASVPTTAATVTALLNAPETSKAVAFAAPSTANSDAVLNVTFGGATTTYNGTVSGSTVTFNGVTIPGVAASSYTLQIQNIRVNASNPGLTNVTESANLSYTVSGVSSTTGIAAANVGFVSPSLSATTFLAGGGNGGAVAAFAAIPACTGNAASATPAFTINFKSLLPGAFKSITGEQGSFVPGGASPLIGTASSGDQILLTLANVPAAATIYIPQTFAGAGITFTLVGSTAITTPTAIAGAAGNPYVAFTPVSGTVAATYSVTGTSTGVFTYAIPTYVVVAGNAAGAQGAITALVSDAPTGTVASPAASVPLFAASTATPATGPTVTICQTSLLFPFVTNQLGFDTGIAIANTSTDALGTSGKSITTAQTGTCSLSFFGAGAPTPSFGVADPQGATASGTTHAFTISAVAPGFQGYVIATCPFQFAHAFAFITYNLTQNNGVAEGYLAEVLSGRATASVGAEVVTF